MNQPTERTWRISREQAAGIGAILGLLLGFRAGPAVRVLAAVALFIGFALAARAAERHFESRLGLVGFFAVVAVSSSLSTVKETLEGIMGVLLFIASVVGLVALGGLGAARLYDSVIDDKQRES